jgi:hypothetical protein
MHYFIISEGNIMIDLSFHILDLAHNAIKANASMVFIGIVESPLRNHCQITIEDNGYGMDKETTKASRDPFYTSRLERKVGLGIPLFIQTCEQANGHVMIYSKPGIGTKIIGCYDLKHIDAIPLGDMEETIYLLMVYSDQVNIIYSHQWNETIFQISSNEIREILIDVPLTEYEVMKSIKQYIKYNITDLREGKE